MTVPSCIFAAEDVLGEGPVWDAARGRLWWVDIKRCLLHWHDPRAASFGTRPLEHQITAVAPRRDSGLLAISRGGVGVLDPETGSFEIRHVVEADRPGNRSNDGTMGLDGRFWFGTMLDAEGGNSGAVYHLNPDWTCARVLDGFGITNTVLTNADGDTLYVADSLKGTMYRAPIATDGKLGSLCVFAQTEGLGGAPDGSAMDAEGCLWNAQWGLKRVVRYRSDGTVDQIISLPVSHVSSCAFGGDDLRTLYITTARHHVSAEQIENEPLAGGLFAIDVGVAGLALPPFEG